MSCATSTRKLAFSLDDMGEQQVKNIARPIRIHRIVLGEKPGRSEPATSAVANSPLALPDKPPIVVLPFQNMSRDPEQKYFADCMVEEIISANPCRSENDVAGRM